MLELKNFTPFEADFVIFPDATGVDTLYTMVKATFHMNGNLSLAEKQKPLVKADEYLGEPINSSLMAASDYHIGKPSTDIIVIGDAITEDEIPKTDHSVNISVGSNTKQLKVFGDRDWVKGRMTSPLEFTRMPIIYERAFGGDGAQWSQDDHDAVDRNPAGVGFNPAGQATENTMDRSLPLPNIEGVDQPIESIDDCPHPAGLGFIAPHWSRRRYLAGTYDQNWQQRRAPYLPNDFRAEYFNCASDGLVCKGYLKGGEHISVEGMNVAGLWEFDLPFVQLQSDVVIGGKAAEQTFNLETVELLPNEKLLSIVWRAQTPVDKRALKIDSISISLLTSNVEI